MWFLEIKAALIFEGLTFISFDYVEGLLSVFEMLIISLEVF